MRASIEKLAHVLRSERKPRHISQMPFDYDDAHYQRLCDCQGRPDVVDLIDYAQDMTYMPLQPELLRHLFPLLLETWRKDMISGKYAGFVQHFWPALLNGRALAHTLSPDEVAAVSEFMRLALLDRMDLESELRFSSVDESPYRWIQAVSAYATVFTEAESFFKEWWKLRTTGHAVAFLQYVSPLIYEDHENPIFEPWTPNRGGGPPCLWENGSHIYDRGWQEVNVQFIQRWMTFERISENVQNAADRLHQTLVADHAIEIAEDVEICRETVGTRLAQLPEFLARPTPFNQFR